MAFQPYFDAGFPHGFDQRIKASNGLRRLLPRFRIVIGVQLSQAVRTYSMRELCLGVRLEITLQRLPRVPLIPDSLAGSTNGKQPAEKLHLFERLLQFGNQTLPLQQDFLGGSNVRG